MSDRSGSDNLWIADRDGRNPRALTRTEGYGHLSPEWTPDGNRGDPAAQGAGARRHQ